MKRLLLALALLTTPALADGLIDNAAGQTLDAKGKPVTFTGLLIGSDGRVTRLLDKGDKPPKKLDYRLDAKGRALIPGRIAPGQRLMQAAIATLAREPQMQSHPLQPYERDLAFAGLQKHLLSEGFTTVVDLDTSIIDWEVYRRAGDAGRLRVRILSYAAGLDTMTTVAGNQPTLWLYDGRLRMAGLAVPDSPPFEDARTRNLISRGTMDGFQVVLLPDGAGATEHALAAIEEVASSYGTDRRWRLQVGATTAPDPARLARSGTLAISDTPQDPRDAAYAAYAETRVGTLTPGMAADFVMLDAKGQPAEVWIGGVRAWVAK